MPAMCIFIVNKFKIGSIISPVLLCYGLGIILGNFGILKTPDKVFESLAQVLVPLAIPLMLMTTDFKKWLLHIRPILKSIFLSILGVIIACFTTFYIFRNTFPDAITSIGMISGSLIGTNVNLSAVGIALKAKSELFLMVSSADVGIGAFFLLFLIVVSKKLYSLILPPYQWKNEEVITPELIEKNKTSLKQYPISIFFAILVGGISIGLSFLFFHKIEEGFTIVCISILSIMLAYKSKFARSLACADDIGQYLLLVFCFLVGLKADFRHIMNDSMIIFYLTFCYYGLSIFFQLILAKIFKIDVDTTIMTTTGTIYGPVFVGQIASAIQNKEVILTGMVTAIFGYSIGTLLSLLLVEVMKLL